MFEEKDEEKVTEVAENTSKDEESSDGDENKVTKRYGWLKMMARVAIFGGLAAILYCVPVLKFKLPIFGFLEFHFDEIPAMLAGFAYGPLTAFFIILLRTLIKLPMTSTMCVGELSDLIYSCALVLPAVIIYSKKRTMGGAWIGFAAGFVTEVVMALLCNGLFMFKFYMYLYGIDMSVICSMFSALKVTNMWTLLTNCILPFNVIKNAGIILITFLIYKPLHKLISKIPFIG